MRLVLILALGFMAGSLAGIVRAEGPREITWGDLLPKEEAEFDDPFARLSAEQLLDLGMVARIRILIVVEKISPHGPDAKEEKKLVAKQTEKDIDVQWMLSQRERVAEMRGSTPNNSLTATD